MDVIVSGPLPLNPADIFLSENFENLIKDLKSKYDKIIIDTAPIGLVADAYMIMKHTDVNLYVVRQNFTNKDVLRFANDLDEKNRVENISLVLNDVSSGSGVYGYGKYGYSYGYGYGYGYGGYTKDVNYFNENEK
jgi:Mrp family chromosome partitioning ATPase